MATVTLASLGLGNADLTAIGKLSETGLSQVEIAGAVVEGDKLKKGNITAGQVGAYTKAEVDTKIADIPATDLSGYYNKTEVDNLIPDISTKQDTLVSGTSVKTVNGESILGSGDIVISGGGAVDLSDYYKKTETYSKVEVDTKIADIPETDLSDYYNKTQVDNIIANIPETDLSNYYDKTEVYSKLESYSKAEVDSLIAGGGADLSEYYTKAEVDNLISAIPETDLTNYYDKTETYNKSEVDTKIADIPATDLSNYYDKLEVDNLIPDISTKQDVLVSATNIKTINGESVLGSGDIVISGGGNVDLTDYYTKSETDSLVDTKQDTLVSGTNIKTINGQSVLGNGNVLISAESSSFIHTPVITSPANGTVDYIGSITSTYSTSESYIGVQDWVRWEASTDENFTTLFDSYEGNSNLTNWAPNISGLDITTVYVRTRQGSDNYLSMWSDVISFTTPDIYVENPTIIVTGTPNDVPKNPTISGSAFSIINGTDTHESTDYQVVRVSDEVVVWESLGNTVDKTSINVGGLEESTSYIFKMRYKGTTYGYSQWVQVTGTTKDVVTISIGVQGKKGFGVAPTDQPFVVLGLAEMTGTNDPESDNYGNYIHTNGSIVCWCPKGYYRVGSSESPRFATYGANALDIVGAETFSTEAEANAAGYALHRAFINAGAGQSGFFVDKYMNSKDGTTASKSVFGGVPISLTATAGYTASKGMTGCTGIQADAVVLSRARGARWNTATAFMYGYLAMVSVAQAQAATSTDDVAWYDPTGVKNFPKGCNNNGLRDTDDTTVVYASAGDSGNASKPKTGATANFAKTTHNGSANGVADLNGGMYEATIGITNFGSSATAKTAITNDQIYVLKQSVDVATLTGGWDGTDDIWGNAANLATKYDLVTSPHPLGSSTGTVGWGNGSNAVFQNDLSGVNRDICGFFPKDASSTSATGVNLFGNDYLYKSNIQNMVPQACGAWLNNAVNGCFLRFLNAHRSLDNLYTSFRASAYFAL